MKRSTLYLRMRFTPQNYFRNPPALIIVWAGWPSPTNECLLFLVTTRIDSTARSVQYPFPKARHCREHGIGWTPRHRSKPNYATPKNDSIAVNPTRSDIICVGPKSFRARKWLCPFDWTQ